MPPVDPSPRCLCHRPTIRLISRTPAHPNEPFYKCPTPPPRQCKYFAWEWRLLGMPTSYAQAGILPPPSSPKTPGKAASQEVRAQAVSSSKTSTKAIASPAKKVTAPSSRPITPSKAAKAAGGPPTPKTPTKATKPGSSAAASTSAAAKPPARAAKSVPESKTPTSAASPFRLGPNTLASRPAMPSKSIGLSRPSTSASPAKSPIKPASAAKSSGFLSAEALRARARGDLKSGAMSPGKAIGLSKRAEAMARKTPVQAMKARAAPESPSPSKRARVGQASSNRSMPGAWDANFASEYPRARAQGFSPGRDMLISEDEADSIFNESDEPLSPIADDLFRAPTINQLFDTAESKAERHMIRRMHMQVVEAAVRAECKELGYATQSDTEDEEEQAYSWVDKGKGKAREDGWRETPRTPSPRKTQASLGQGVVPPMTPVTPAKRSAPSPDRSDLTPAIARLTETLQSSPYPIPINFTEPELNDAVASGEAAPIVKCASRLIEHLVWELGEKEAILEAVQRGDSPQQPTRAAPFDYDFFGGSYTGHHEEREEELDDDQLEAQARARGEDGFVGKWGKWHDLHEYPGHGVWDRGEGGEYSNEPGNEGSDDTLASDPPDQLLAEGGIEADEQSNVEDDWENHDPEAEARAAGEDGYNDRWGRWVDIREYPYLQPL